jgi:hypothetical protein
MESNQLDDCENCQRLQQILAEEQFQEASQSIAWPAATVMISLFFSFAAIAWAIAYAVVHK